MSNTITDIMLIAVGFTALIGIISLLVVAYKDWRR